MAVTGRGTHPLLSTWLALPGQGAGYVAALGTDPAQQGEAIWLDWQFQGTVAGGLGATLGAATLAAAGAVDVRGAASATLDGATLIGDASVFITGVLAAMLGDATLVGAGGEELEPAPGRIDSQALPTAVATSGTLLGCLALSHSWLSGESLGTALLGNFAAAAAVRTGEVLIETGGS